jgi:LmbE family N-acetylglucosaminyl deacetylase
MNPYQKFVTNIADLVKQAKSYPLGGFPPAPRPNLPDSAPKALFFAPHPDDECIVGGIAVRMLRESGMHVINVAVTQGSKKERQAERYVELRNACDYLGFGLVPTGPNGLEKVTLKTREQDPAHWRASVQVILGILKEHQPKVILFPHDQDWNGTHIGTHHLVMDALRLMSASFSCYTVETEFWGQMDDPNLMVELSSEDLVAMITATTFHVGEVQRNPYHLLLPAFAMDNVRRGSELVGGQGGAAPEFTFATLYRLRKWANGAIQDIQKGGRQVPQSMSIGTLFP